MSDFPYSKALLVLVGLTVADTFWTLYITHVGLGQRLNASCASFMIIAVQALCVSEYVLDKRLIPFAAVGAFLGTWLPMTYTKHKKAV